MSCVLNQPIAAIEINEHTNIRVAAAVDQLLLLSTNQTDFSSSPVDQPEQLIYSETHAGLLRCVAVGGYPPVDLSVFIGRREMTSELDSSRRSARLTGSRGLRLIEHTVELADTGFKPRAADDGKTARCVAAIGGLVVNTTQTTVVVNCE